MTSADTDKSLLRPTASARRTGVASPAASPASRWLSLRSIPSVLLGGVCVWALVRLFVLWTEEGEVAGDKASHRPAAVVSDADETVAERSPPRIDKEHLFAVRVLHENLRIEPLAKNALRPGEATILNFWGTFCTPCKDELPAFQSLMRELRAPMLHFVPVLVDDQVKASLARTMYDELHGPSPSEFVADGRLPDVDDPRLTELQAALGGRVNLPTTVVIDCERRIRWSKTRKLETKDFLELRGVLGRVLGELDTPTCVAARKRARRLEQGHGQHGPPDDGPGPRSTCHADGECDADRGETVKNCPVDCQPKIRIPRVSR